MAAKTNSPSRTLPGEPVELVDAPKTVKSKLRGTGGISSEALDEALGIESSDSDNDEQDESTVADDDGTAATAGDLDDLGVLEDVLPAAGTKTKKERKKGGEW